MGDVAWLDLGSLEDFESELTEVQIGKTKLAISNRGGKYGAISNICNHVGGPLGRGKLDGEYVVCPWHNWKFHRLTGEGEPGFEEDVVPRHEIKVESGHLFASAEPITKRKKKPHEPHPLARSVSRLDGPLRVVGISTTAMDKDSPRYSTSEDLLNVALDHAKTSLGAETRLIRLNDLSFRNCEGYYSKGAGACTWPCSITQVDKNDQMDLVYEALVHWADVVLIATPIRWGAASSLTFKMAERLNCVQNQITLRNNVLIRNKVVSFIISGGQDNIQAVAGQLLMFFAELGFSFPQFPFIAHSRGWSAEDMERNEEYVKNSEELRNGAKELAKRSVEHARILLDHFKEVSRTERGGRKAHRLDSRS